MRSKEAVDANAVVAAGRVDARGTVLAHRRACALVHVERAVGARPLCRALALVSVDAVHAGAAVAARMRAAVIVVALAVAAGKAGRTVTTARQLFLALFQHDLYALIVPVLIAVDDASAAVGARRRLTRAVEQLTVAASETGRTFARIRAVQVGTLGAAATWRPLVALIDVSGAIVASEVARTLTHVACTVIMSIDNM